ncbi:Hypothetical protein R9X50_00297400 [Acrodontium crateriforme]|uniref:Zn(2)-C6 fungal-type domain-containing protein n=1 Tax=Acrodontium crateriforme TaxID=150365 RepID=A0AAQ3R927_9PEZI|nr:Hypothetical protein R9X50_00297400 [Acrodontium crateriforme]
MDVRRFSAAHSHPPPPPPPPHLQQQQHHHQQHQHQQTPPLSQPQPLSTVDPRAPYSPHYPPAQYPPPHNPSPSQQQPPYSNPSSAAPTRPHSQSQLPPLPQQQQQQQLPQHQLQQQTYGPPRPSHPHLHNQREGQEYPQYTQGRSEHATPAPPVNRAYPHDTAPQRTTPTTPSQTVSYPPGPPHDGAPTAPPQHLMDHGHHGPPMTNGVQHGLPPHQHGLPPHDPNAQYMAAPMMEAHHQYPPPGPQPVYAQYSTGPAGGAGFQVQQRKKQMRATQACEQCRQRKQKCDEGQPCSFCKENDLTCQYRDTPPAKTDKNMEKLMSIVEQGLQKHDEQLATSQQQLAASQQNLTMIQGLLAELKRMNAKIERLESKSPDRRSAERPPSSNGLAATEAADVAKSASLDHRTPPHKLLLLWPSVRNLFLATDHGHLPNTTYVMEAESRGLLRLHTRGEGIDGQDGTQPGEAASPGQSEDGSGDNFLHNGIASSPPEGLWGTGFPHTPQSDVRRNESFTWGGLRPDGSLDLDVNTINTLFDSYMKHMHIMHPFLDRQRVRGVFDIFIRRYATGQPRIRSSFAVPEGERAAKRQRSNGSVAVHLPQSEPSPVQRNVQTERSPANALVYLVMALGKICLHKEPLPGMAQDNKLNANATVRHQMNRAPGFSPISANLKHSPTSPLSGCASHHTPPAGDGPNSYARSRRSSMDSSSGPRNVDVIPGLAYYAKATEIIGEQADGNDLVHAQMFLLAGLYKGQLARVQESMSFFQMAGRAVIRLLDTYKLYNAGYRNSNNDDPQLLTKNYTEGQKLIKDKRDNLIVLAAWTCLQLESDILAELRLPSSGIQDIESLLLMPHKVPDDETYDGLDGPGSSRHDNIMIYYSAQTFLRKRLNQVHKQMYGADCLNHSLEQVREMLQGHEYLLEAWRASLPEQLKWKDDDPLPENILDARLRAKYWGARYVVNRPFLDYALHIMSHVMKGCKVRDVAVDVYGKPRDPAEIHLFEAIETMGDLEVWEGSKRCIHAAMQSTKALDGVPGRLIVTNIHGTAHAQFGNMLVLSATYHTPHLNELVKRDEFRALLQRTITFLRRLVPISPTCEYDCSLLENIQRMLFKLPPDEKAVYLGEKPFFPNEAVGPRSASTSFGHST